MCRHPGCGKMVEEMAPWIEPISVLDRTRLQTLFLGRIAS